MTDSTQTDDPITYVDAKPLPRGSRLVILDGAHVHHRMTDECLRREAGELCENDLGKLRALVEEWREIVTRSDQRILAIEAAAAHPHKGPNDTDASMLREASHRIERGFAPGGSNTTATVMRVLGAVADLLEPS